MGLKVLDPGLWATVQDAGRPGFRAWGVPEGGAFDRSSHGLANALAGNRRPEAALELTLRGGSFEALGPLALALAGAPMPASIDRCGERVALAIPCAFGLRAGDRLELGTARRGVRAYLAVAGGWRTAEVLGSRSSEDRLPAGSVLDASPGSSPLRRPRVAVLPDPEAGPIRVLAGPDLGLADPAWLDADYRVGARSDRMGLRLEGPGVSVRADPARPSMPVAPGAIQATGGRLIVLGVAAGTMGGYPHVGQVISADLDRLAQAAPGATLRFRPVHLAEARRLDAGRRRRLAGWLARVATAASDAGPSAAMLAADG